jgi:anti-sigma B factor antagonist
MAASYTIRETISDGIAYVDIAGDLDFGAKSALESQVADQLTSGDITSIVVDIAGVSFIDSAGIGALVTCRRHAEDAGTTLLVVGANGRVADMMDLTGVRQWLAGETGPATVAED